jgi:mRNA turnover protein 4
LKQQYLRGQVGLLFTNKAKEYVTEWFQKNAQTDFARSGNEATETITLEAGTL